jgi:hypothetical protein
MEILLEELGNQPFSISIDASNHCETKLFPLVIRFYNFKTGLRTRLLDMTSLPGETAKEIFDWICATLKTHNLEMKNLISFCADNAPTNFGKPTQLREGREGNNVFSKLKEKQKSLIPIGCCGFINYLLLKIIIILFL